MKNKLQHHILKINFAVSFIYIIILFIAQILITSGFEMLDQVCGIHDMMIDVAEILGMEKGLIMISTFDMIRVVLSVILLIPYGVVLEYFIKKEIVIPVDQMCNALKKMSGENLAVKMNLPLKNELLDMQTSFNDMADRLLNTTNDKKRIQAEKQFLISGMAHDLRTPITTIRGYSQALKDKVVTDEQKQQDYLNAIYNKSYQLEELVNLLFDYVNMDNIDYKNSTECIDIIEIIRECIALVYTDFEDKKISVQFDLLEEPVYILAHKKQICRVFANIYGNALKYNGEGNTVYTNIKIINDKIEIVVADDGIEIEDEIAEHIFDAFVMGDYSRKSGTGNGLGLCIAKKIINMYHGTIQLEKSINNYKKAFIIKLPIYNKGEKT